MFSPTPPFSPSRSAAGLLPGVCLLACIAWSSAAEKEEAAAIPAPATSADAVFAAPPPMDLNGFGSDEPVDRPDMPSRGVIKFGPKDFVHTTMEHWEQYDWAAFHPKRWGRYSVRVTYTLGRPSLPVQFRLGEQRLKKNVPAAREPKQIHLGEVNIEKADIAPFSMFSPTSGAQPGMDIREVAFVPVRESDETLEPAADGSITLPAKAATTWSEIMRYEPKAEKNCLGFWSETEDFAEWEFVAPQPGRYRVVVTQGCGAGQGGSRVEARLADQACAFTVEDTGGFQNWKDIDAGVIEIKAPGLQRLALKPLEKKAKAVLDVSKVVLTPVGGAG